MVFFDAADGLPNEWFGVNCGTGTQEHAPRGDLCAHVETSHASVGAEEGTLRIGAVGVKEAGPFSWCNWKPR